MAIHETMRVGFQQIKQTIEAVQAEIENNEDADTTATSTAEGAQQSTAPSFMQLVQGTLKQASKQVSALFGVQPVPMNKPTPVSKPDVVGIVTTVVEAPVEPVKPIVIPVQESVPVVETISPVIHTVIRQEIPESTLPGTSLPVKPTLAAPEYERTNTKWKKGSNKAPQLECKYQMKIKNGA